MEYSYSILNDARRCLKYFELKHIKRIEVPGELNGDLEFGTAIHLGIDDILTDGGDGITIFEAYWNALGKKQVDYGRFSYENLYDQAKTIFRKFIKLHAKNFTDGVTERRLRIKVGDHVLAGTPDFVGLYKGKKTIVDFKTSAYNYPKEKILCEEQLSLYKELEEKVNGFKATSKLYIVFKKDYADPSIQTLSGDFDSAQTAGVLLAASSLCNELGARKEFFKNPSSCIVGQKKCPYFDMCWGSKC